MSHINLKDPTGKNLFEVDNVDTFPEDANLLKRRINALERDLERANSQDDSLSPTSPRTFLNESQIEFILDEK
ncbi:hypothetical protein LOD99_12334 [Oopsacas minuta]|uniref:Uncharacterized protein n=1 Tax=Oopsacas minuta TaxID=111878 RepID=A0AAV7JES9_9METZ|nr:hypothetical protein LOD99_12334 [Oopsacas minuta]